MTEQRLSVEWALIAWTFAGEALCLDYRGPALRHHVETLGNDVVDVLRINDWDTVTEDAPGLPGQLLVWQGACLHGDPDQFVGELRQLTVTELAELIECSASIESWDNVQAKRGQLMGDRACRRCGCTEDDCSQCVAASGEPCQWVEADLCSRCVAEDVGPFATEDTGGAS